MTRAPHAAAVAAALLLSASSGRAEVYLTVDRALSLAFPDAEDVAVERIHLSARQRSRVEERAGVALRDLPDRVYVARRGGRTAGYAMVTDVPGKARPITMLVALDPRGRVERVEILAYRESRGGEVRYPAFLRQFKGKGPGEPLRHRREIRNITGATISCRAVTRGVRTLLALWEVIYGAGRVGP